MTFAPHDVLPRVLRPSALRRRAGMLLHRSATLAELAGGKPPAKLDSISLVPTLLGRGTQRKHEYLYWEFYEQGVSQAVLLDGRWKALRLKTTNAPVQLFDLKADPAEKTDVAAQNAALVARATELMKTARFDNAHWKLSGPPTKAPAP